MISTQTWQIIIITKFKCSFCDVIDKMADRRRQLGVDGFVEQTGRKRFGKWWSSYFYYRYCIFVEMSGMVPGRKPRRRQRERWSNAC